MTKTKKETMCLSMTGFCFPIELRQRGPDNFTVQYGQQIKSGLDYTAAALELGACIMHALACDSKLDNSEAD